MLNKFNIIMLVYIMTLPGCSSNSVKKVDHKTSERVVVSHINQLKQKYNDSFELQNIELDSNKINSEWIQPHNKSKGCLVYRDYMNNYPKDSISAWNKERGVADYKILWDGDCKDGYASGLGREIEKGKGVDRYTLSRYSIEAKVKPIRYLQEDYLSGNRREGDLNNQVYVDISHPKKDRSNQLNQIKIGESIVNVKDIHQPSEKPFSIEDVVGIDIKPISNSESPVLTYGFIESSINKTSKAIQINNLDEVNLEFISQYYDGSSVSSSKSVFESKDILNSSAWHYNDKGNRHGLSLAKHTMELGSIFERNIESINLWNDGEHLGAIDKVNEQVKEEYINFLTLIEKDSSDIANLALINRIASLDAKKEYMDNICTEGNDNSFCGKEDYDEALNKYVALIKNIRSNTEIFKPKIVAIYNKIIDDVLERSAQGPNYIADILSFGVIYNRYRKKIKSNKSRRGYGSSRGGYSSPSSNTYNYSNQGFNILKKPDLGFYCNTYTDDFLCNTGANKSYLGSSGSGYKYDLSNPFDRLQYSNDIGSQINDAFSSDRFLDQGLGQFGGGID